MTFEEVRHNDEVFSELFHLNVLFTMRNFVDASSGGPFTFSALWCLLCLNYEFL